MHLYNPPKAASFIPVIDVSSTLADDGAALAKTAQAVHRACRDTGFFYISNHGVSPRLIADQFAAVRQLFDLPDAKKQAMQVRNSPTLAGYAGIGFERLDSQDKSAPAAPADLNESFYVGREMPAGHSYGDRVVRSFGHNQWPAALPDFRAVTLAYYEEVRRLANRVMGLLALSLDLPRDRFEKAFERSTSALRLLRYPPHPARAAVNQLGAGAHTDWSAMTVLAQDDVGGLEVRNVEGDWISAPPIDGTFVVNLGDLMARWTNGIYKSNFHRVLNNVGEKDRYSVPFFHGPGPFEVIDAIPTCIDENHPRLFATCTTAEHLDEMYRRAHGFSMQAVA